MDDKNQKNEIASFIKEELDKIKELSDLTKSLFITGLKMRYPEYSEKDIIDLYIEKIHKCHVSDF